MSDLNSVALTLAGLVTNTDVTANQMRLYSRQIKDLVFSASNIMSGTLQREYQELINQLLTSKTKIDFAIGSLESAAKFGNDWLREHISSFGGGGNLSQGRNDYETNTDTKTYEESLKPTRNAPRDLTVSQYGFLKNANGMEVYDSPLEVDKYLYSKQGSAYQNFKGTCGLCSCANVIRLAGVNYGEKEMIDYAAGSKRGGNPDSLCTVDPFNPSASGGTTPKQRQQILEHFGISSSIRNIKTDEGGRTSDETIKDIAGWISEGRGVIVDVDAGLFYDSPKNYGKGHAITITSVEKNKHGDITAFFILDSNQGTVKCSSWDLQEMLRTFVDINVTNQIIR